MRADRLHSSRPIAQWRWRTAASAHPFRARHRRLGIEGSPMAQLHRHAQRALAAACAFCIGILIARFAGF